MRKRLLGTGLAVIAMVVMLAGSAGAAPPLPTSFPGNFPVPVDSSLGSPVIGFGASGPVARTPVIFLHGNNDTPFPTACNPFFGDIHDLASSLLARGYSAAELWGLGYQGEQCDILADPTLRSGVAHSTVANVPDLRRFVHAVLEYTGAKRVDIVGHSLGGTVARAWMKEDSAYHLVRRLATIDSPHHGIINCGPLALGNFWALPAFGGFTPESAVCREYGADDTPFLRWLNAGSETPGGTRVLSVRNIDRSFVYIPVQDGLLPPVPAIDRDGDPHDFSQSARLRGAENVTVTGQGAFDPILGTAHLGILNSPAVWTLVADFLTRPKSGPNNGSG